MELGPDKLCHRNDEHDFRGIEPFVFQPGRNRVNIAGIEPLKKDVGVLRGFCNVFDQRAIHPALHVGDGVLHSENPAGIEGAHHLICPVAIVARLRIRPVGWIYQRSDILLYSVHMSVVFPVTSIVFTENYRNCMTRVNTNPGVECAEGMLLEKPARTILFSFTFAILRHEQGKCEMILGGRVGTILKQRILQSMAGKDGSLVRIKAGRLRGLRVFIDPSSPGLAVLFGRWEPYHQALYEGIVRQGDVVYDIGANTGIHSLLFSTLVGQHGKVFSFEPLSQNIHHLEMIQSGNDISNIVIMPMALADRTGTARFKLGVHNTQGSLVGIGADSGAEIEVPLSTLDAERAKGMPAAAVMKMDIEGAEGVALAGGAAMIDADLPIVVVELHTPEQDRAIADFFHPRPYRLYRLGDDGARTYSDQRELLRPIQNTRSTWPDPLGVWGTVVAVPHSRHERIDGIPHT
ncbi:MAG: FkbM family methyltransferase [Ignavibacteria bacterium]|nr:FkbM family methyltransferase [Ignavibacteria bacterium]